MVSASEAAELGSIDFYSDSPWLIRGNMPWLQPLFASSDSVTLKAGTETLLGAERSVFLIEQGLIATFAVCESLPERMTALFGVGAVLGGTSSRKDQTTHRQGAYGYRTAAAFSRHVPRFSC